MEGFLPLIEGFLAFALTLLALTTAVSAIVGVGHRVRRRRARGLRDMVRWLYLKDIRPLWRKVDPGKQLELADRIRFIADMTLMPLPVVVNKLEAQEEEAIHWRQKLEQAEPQAGHLFSLRRWRTLRYGLDALPDDEFRQRLAESAAGRALREHRAWRSLGLGSWEELEEGLLRSFQAVGAASSETFARHSRSWSVAVGFVLAFALNIDSFDLLNSYLTDPELRATVIQRSDQVLSEARAPADGRQQPTDGGALPPGGEPAEGAEAPAGQLSLAQAGSRLRSQVDHLAADAERVTAQLQAGLARVGGEEAAALSAQLEAELARIADGTRGLRDLEQSFAQAERQVVGVAQALTASFPIGWSRFPRCPEATATDLRCLGGEQPARTVQWFAGVLLTGLLLGLGTPFWIQVVTSLLSLRRWGQPNDRNDGKGQTEGPAREPTADSG